MITGILLAIIGMVSVAIIGLITGNMGNPHIIFWMFMCTGLILIDINKRY